MTCANCHGVRHKLSRICAFLKGAHIENKGNSCEQFRYPKRACIQVRAELTASDFEPLLCSALNARCSKIWERVMKILENLAKIPPQRHKNAHYQVINQIYLLPTPEGFLTSLPTISLSITGPFAYKQPLNEYSKVLCKEIYGFSSTRFIKFRRKGMCGAFN